MKNVYLWGWILVWVSIFPLKAQEACPVPLYTDPVYKGAADPEVIWNEYEEEWWMFYTSRRAVCEGAPLPALAIGVAVSKDWKAANSSNSFAGTLAITYPPLSNVNAACGNCCCKVSI